MELIRSYDVIKEDFDTFAREGKNYKRREFSKHSSNEVSKEKEVFGRDLFTSKINIAKKIQA